MGKRKATRLSPELVAVQCDVWLTAKPPKKQKILSRDPIYNAQIREEPTLVVPTATKQTTLNDFFGKRLHSGRAQPEEVHNHPETHHTVTEDRRILHQIQPSQENIRSDAQSVASPVKQVKARIKTGIRCKKLTPKDKNKLNGDILGSYGNQKSNFQSPSDKQLQDRCQVKESDRTISRGSLAVKEQNHREDSMEEDEFADDNENVAIDTACNIRRISGKCKAKDAFLKQRIRLEDFPTDVRDSHLPCFGVPSSKASSNHSSAVKTHPPRITFVRLEEAESSLYSQETAAESSTADQSACSYQTKVSPLGYSYPQSSLNVGMLRYVDPDLLDTAPMPDSQTQTQKADSDSHLITNHSQAGSEFSDTNLSIGAPKWVDPVLLEVNTAEMSTEQQESLSEGNRFVDDPALILDQSPLDSPEFTVGTQGCLVLKRPPEGGDMDDDDDDVDDSQMF